MARPKNTIRTKPQTINLPEDLIGRIELELFSEVEGRIPLGAKQEFFVTILRQHFKQQDRKP